MRPTRVLLLGSAGRWSRRAPSDQRSPGGIATLIAALMVATPVEAADLGTDAATRFAAYGPFQIQPSDYVDGGAPDADKVELGRLLFFDKILSGNQDISCATCHHPSLATADDLSLGVGTGGRGLGPDRTTGDEVGTPIARRMPRNTLALFGLGHADHKVAFFDGRVRELEDGSFESPAGEDLPKGLDHIVAVTATFPVQPHEEMSGEPGENPIADAAAVADFPRIWALLAARLKEISEYVRRFRAVFGIERRDITYAHAANAIGAFIIEYGRVLTTPFARYAQGDETALPSSAARRGAEIFFGRGGCAECHAGPLFSDMDFHAIALPQVGPGKGHGWKGLEDLGRAGVTGNPKDLLKFRTPILLNIGYTAPYGHAGQYAELKGIIRHHAAPARSLGLYRCGLNGVDGQLVMPARPDLDLRDCAAHGRARVRQTIAAANELEPARLSDRDLRDIVQFLYDGLTDHRSLKRLPSHLPSTVPSGLPVD